MNRLAAPAVLPSQRRGLAPRARRRPAARVLFALCLAGMTGTSLHAAEPPRWTLRVTVRDQVVEGMPLNWSEKEVSLLARDGRLLTFRPTEASSFSRTSSTFRPCTAGEVRFVLQSEFGDGYDVSGTGHYLVVHPAGQRDYWAERFEELYRSFVHYFAVRGLRVRPPEFPLVGIVVRNQAEMARYAAAEGLRISPGVLGYYSHLTNRVILYDQGGGQASRKHWSENSSTIIHEATHQTAFNCGVHSRTALPPRWLAEGLGTLFEAPGVWDSRNHPHLSDRINRGRLEDFRKVAGQTNAAVLAHLVSQDELFATSPGGAYAIGWALTLYLSEAHPRQYGQLLARTAARPPFSQYPPQERLADFTSLFGKDFAMLNARFQRFMADLE